MTDAYVSMVAFVLAFSSLCFSDTSRVGVVVTTVAWTAIAVLVGWTVFPRWRPKGIAISNYSRKLRKMFNYELNYPL